MNKKVNCFCRGGLKAALIILLAGIMLCMQIGLTSCTAVPGQENDGRSGRNESASAAPDQNISESAALDQGDSGSASDGQGGSGSSLWVEFVDVGQGDCAIIQCDGHFMMIDGGGAKASATVYSVLKSKQITSLDYVIATHPDADHIGGLSGAINYASVGTCYSPVDTHDTSAFADMVKYLKKQGKTVVIPEEYQTVSLGSATVEIFLPECTTDEDDTNNHSIITRITCGFTSFLFMGDAEETEETALINMGYDLKSDVLKIGHHGSAYSTSEKLLRAVSPGQVIISVGNDNDYGHPSAAALERLKNAGVNIYRTDLEGNIDVSSDGTEVSVTTEKTTTEEFLWASGDRNPEQTVTDTDTLDSADGNDTEAVTYVVNTSSRKFHLPTCSSVKKISTHNRLDYTGTREELVDMGYEPCKNCNP